MRPLHPVEEVRAAEEALMSGLPAGALMQRAASGLACRCAQLLGSVYGRRVVLLVGTGDNGGDALFAGARLARRGARVEALLAGPRAHEAGLVALRAAGGRAAPLADAAVELFAGPRRLGRDDVVVDGLLGIGGRGGLRDPAAGVAGRLPGTGATVVAVDVPSGVDAGTGRVAGVAVRADVTVTFGTLKPGLVVDPGASYAGRVECVDIGLADELPAPHWGLLDADDVAGLLADLDSDTNKYRRGVLGVLAGSERYMGAAVLATGAGIRAGAGMVRFTGVPHAAQAVRAHWPEAVVTVVPAGGGGSVADPAAVLDAGRVQAWVLGPGLGTDDDAGRVVQAVLDTALPVLVDADALTLVATGRVRVAGRPAPTLLTPHAGEFARLFGCERAAVEGDRLTWARRAAAELGVTVLLKGTTTVVADPSGDVRVNPTGTAALATAGSGDVLSGGGGALLARGLSALDAGAAGAFLHGLAGRLAAARFGGPAPVAASDVLAHWPAAVAAASS